MMKPNGGSVKTKELSTLLKVLREHGVEEYSSGDTTVKFGARSHFSNPIVDIDALNIEPQKSSDKALEDSDEDILFWSSGGK